MPGTDDSEATGGAPAATASAPGRFRQFCMGAVVFVTCTCTVLAATSYWVHETALDTDKYVATVKPIAHDRAVTEAMSLWMSDQLLEVVNAQKIIRDALPEGGRILAAPLANAVRTFIQQQIDKILQTDAFERAWVLANTAAHRTAVAVLRDETGSNVVSTSNGKVSLNLLPLVNEALRQLQEASPDILGREVQLPEIKSGDVPEDARRRIQDALGVTIPRDFGQIVVFDSSQLDTAQDVVRWFDRGNVALIALAVLLLAFTVWVSHRRRRTVIQLGVGIAVGLVVMRRASVVGKNSVLDNVDQKVNRDAFDAAIGHVLANFLSFSAWLIFLSLLVAVVAFLTGPNPRAVQVRRATQRLLREAASGLATAGTEHEDDPVLKWIRDNHVALQAGAAGAVAVAFLVFSLSWASTFLLFVLLAIFEFIVYFLSAATRSKSIGLPPRPPLSSPAAAPSTELEPVVAGELEPTRVEDRAPSSGEDPEGG